MDTSAKIGKTGLLIIIVGLSIFLSSNHKRILQSLFLNISQIHFLKEDNAAADMISFASTQKWLDRAVLINPENQNLRSPEMRLYLAMDNPELVLEMSMAADQTGTMDGLWLGHALLETNRFDDALDTWQRNGVKSDYLIGKAELSGDRQWLDLAKRFDHSSHTLFLIGRAYENLSFNSDSVEMYRQANELDSGWLNEHERFFSQYLMTLKLFSLRGDQVDNDQVKIALLKTLNAAQAVDPQTLPILYLRLGIVAQEMQDYQLAKSSFQELVTLSTNNDPLNYVLLAESVFLAREDPDAALDHFAKAIVLSNYDPGVIARINKFALDHEQTYGLSWLEQLSGILSNTIDFSAVEQ